MTSVPHPHGADAGEESLRQEVLQHPAAVDYVILMDAAGRRSIRRAVDDQDEAIRVVAPPFLFYILYDNDLISTDIRPEYVTVYHPGFSEDPRILSEILFWDENRDLWGLRLEPLGEIQDEFEFPQTDEPGTCGVVEDD